MDMTHDWQQRLNDTYAELGRLAMQREAIDARLAELKRVAASLDGALQAAKALTPETATTATTTGSN